MRKLSLIAVATSVLAFGATASAFALEPILSTVGSTITWTGTALDISAPNAAIYNDTDPSNPISLGTGVVTFTGLDASTPATPSGGIYKEALTGGDFSFGSALSGTFTGATLIEDPADEDVNLNFSGVDFTGGSQLPGWNATPSALVLGLNLEGNPTLGVDSGTGFLDPFTATDPFHASGTPSTPEPASVETFGIGAAALMLLAIARRRKANSTL